MSSTGLSVGTERAGVFRLPLPGVDELRRWSTEQLLQWLHNIGLEDCSLPILQRNLSGRDFASLSEEDLMKWNDLPVVRRRQLLQYLEHISKFSSSLVLEAEVHPPKEKERDRSIKGIFETLSRKKGRSAARKLSIAPPAPLPADYKPPPSVTAIVVSPQHIQAQKKLASPASSGPDATVTQHDCDWGSEFSDSGSETEENSSIILTPADHDLYHGQSNSGSFTGDSYRGDEEGFEENIYELPDDYLPEHDHHPVAPNGKPRQPPQHVNSTPSFNPVLAPHRVPCRRSCSTDLTSTKPPDLPAENGTLAARRNSSWIPTKPLSYPTTPNGLHAKEVAERLNILLANRPSLGGVDKSTGYATGMGLLRTNRNLSLGGLSSNVSTMTLNRSTSVGSNPSPSTPLPNGNVFWDTIGETDMYTDTRQRPQVPPKPKVILTVAADPLDPFSWYHGKIDRKETCTRLERTGTNGAFLVRRSLRGAEKFGSPYSLSIYFSGKVYHLTIRQRPDLHYALGFEKEGEQGFRTVGDMVEHHYRNPIYLSECDTGVLLVMALTKAILC